MNEAQIAALTLIACVSFFMSYFGAAVGLVLGQLRVVLLTYVLGSAAVGGATSIAISTVGTLAGAIAHARGKRVNLVLLATIGVPSALGAYAAAGYANHANPRILKLGIAVALLVTALLMLRQVEPGTRQAKQTADSPGHSLLAFLEQVMIGGVLGVFSGLVGLLLGTLRLPAMLKVPGVDPATAVGTNMAIGAVTGLSAGFTALAGGRIHLAAFAVVGPVTLLGSHFGAQRTALVRPAALKRWIAYALILSALLMFCEVTLFSRFSPK